jgi:hypothetical protein
MWPPCSLRTAGHSAPESRLIGFGARRETPPHVFAGGRFLEVKDVPAKRGGYCRTGGSRAFPTSVEKFSNSKSGKRVSATLPVHCEEGAQHHISGIVMELSKATKSASLERTIGLDELDRWQALTILVDARSRLKKYHSAKAGIDSIERPEDFWRLAGLHGSEPVKLSDLLGSRLNPHFLLWVVLRPELIPPSLLHAGALRFCQDFHDRLAKDSVYVDFRYPAMLEAKKRWVNRTASLGELYHVQREASQLLVDISRMGEPRAVAAASAALGALDEDPREALLKVFRAVDDVYSANTENQRRLAWVQESLA